MRGINKAIVVGNLGADPETRYMPSGGAVTEIRIATSETWKDKDGGEQKERTEWHRVVAYGRLAEIMGEYLKKGRQVYIEGSLRTEKWTDRDGNERWTTKIIAREMQMLGGRGGSAEFDSSPSNSSQSGGGSYQPRSEPQPRQQSTTPNAGIEEDDIPF